jgi:hypothetical protein
MGRPEREAEWRLASAGVTPSIGRCRGKRAVLAMGADPGAVAVEVDDSSGSRFATGQPEHGGTTHAWRSEASGVAARTRIPPPGAV